MEFKEFIAGHDDNDRRLDRIIRNFISKERLSNLYKTIRKGLIQVNGKKTGPEQHVFEGDTIKIASFLLENNNEEEKVISKYKFPYQIIFQNENIIIINKPYNKNVHGTEDSIEKDVEKFYSFYTPVKTSLSFKPGPLHRLDRMTTGLLAFSWSLQGAQWFSENIANHNIKKTYIGIVQGHITKEYEWNDYVSKENDDSKNFHKVEISTSYKEDSKLAITKIYPLWNGKYKNIDISLVKYSIETGRTHQIRSQSALHGFPLLGDTAYGGIRLNIMQTLFLHAYQLDIPDNNKISLPCKIKAELPKNFEDFLLNADCEIKL